MKIPLFAMNFLIRNVHRYKVLNNLIFREKSHFTVPSIAQHKCQTFIRPFSDLVSAPEELAAGRNTKITDEFINDITNNDSELANKLKVLMLEAEVMRQDGRKAPEIEYLTKGNWEFLLSLPTRSSRQKYLGFLWKNEKSDQSIKEKKAKSKIILKEVQALRAQQERKDTDYGLTKNAMFLRIYDSSMNQLYNKNLINAMQFGQKIIIDCSYDKYMTIKEALNAAKQLTLLFADNRVHNDPFDVQMCNCSPDSIVMKQLEKNIPTINDPVFPLTRFRNSYMDNFPKEKLVYLTPHCRNDLTEFDHDAIYIIGCMVDKVKSEPISLAKAKQDGIKMARFPLDKYLQWGAGSGKSLTINQVCSILLDLKKTGDWNTSLKHVPVRKLMQFQTTDDAGSGNFENKKNYRDKDTSRRNEKKKLNNDVPLDFKRRRLYSRTSLWSSE